MQTRLISAVLALSTTLSAQRPQDALTRLLASGELASGRIGVHVVDLATGKELCGHDAGKGFMTASNMKLIASAVALYTLGPEFRFRTTLEMRGSVQSGSLMGDLLLVGSGDPTFGGRHEPAGALVVLERMANDAAAAGLTEVRGDIIGDDGCQPREIMGEGWSWGYQGASYAAQVSGLCFAENCIRVIVTGTTAGAPPEYRLVPDTDLVKLSGDWVRTVPATGPEAAKVGLSIRRLRARNEVAIAGAIRAGKRVERTVSIEDPPLYAARALKQALAAAGVRVPSRAASGDNFIRGTKPETRVLSTHESPPLSEILATMNKVSQNLYAEQIIRAASRKATSKSHMRDAEAHAKTVLEKLGVDTRGLAIADGSGLTRLNLVQPRQLTALLRAIWRGPHRALFFSTLPVAGRDGTLRNRFRTSPARDRVRAKTGYISRVVALSGYVPRPDPQAPPLVFSVLLNNFTCQTADAKNAVDTFVTALARHAGWTAPEQARKAAAGADGTDNGKNKR